LGLDSTANLVPVEYKPSDQVSLWKEAGNRGESALATRTGDEIEKYVLSLCKSYFRTTKKASLTTDCLLTDHGLDSLDTIELII
jgi:hypothetical protein